MPLTPEDVSNKRFTPVRLREGYDMGEVDQFLDEVEAELARLTSENDDLRASWPRPAGSSPAAATAAITVSRHRSRSRAGAEPVEEAERRARRGRSAVAAPETIRGHARSARRPAPRPVCSRSPTATPTSSSPTPRTRPTRSSPRPAPRPSGSRPSRRPRPTGSRPTPEPRAEARLRDRRARQQLFGDLEQDRDKLNARAGGPARVRARVPQPAEELLHRSSSRRSTRPTTAFGAEASTQAPKRLRSMLGEDEG